MLGFKPQLGEWLLLFSFQGLCACVASINKNCAFKAPVGNLACWIPSFQPREKGGMRLRNILDPGDGNARGLMESLTDI